MGGKAFAQYEFEYVFDSIKNETPCALFQEIMELDNGDFILNGRDLTQYYMPTLCIYQFSPTGELIKEKQFDNELQLPGYTLADDEGFRLLVNKNGGYYMFITYNPIFDTTNTNYVPGTFDSKIMMKRLDDEIDYSREMSIYLDTVDWRILWGQNASGCQAPKIVLGTVMDNDGEGFVISYEKYIGEHPQHLWEHGNDSTFFLKTDYDLNVNKVGFYEHNRCNGDKKHKNHLLYDSEDNKYIYYTASDWSQVGEKKGFYAHIFDDEFNFIEENMLPNSDGTGFHTYYLRDEVSSTAGITFKRTTNKTTILGAGAHIPTVQQSNYYAAVCLELNDKAKMIDSMTFAGGVPSYGANRTSVPASRSIDWVDESRIFVGATFDSYYLYSNFQPKYQYFTLRLLDRSLNTECEMYYDMGKDSTALWINTLKATRDGGCIIAGHFRNYVENPNDNYPRAFHSVVKKFPPEAFDGIEEAHENGLKVAFAYPNPGNNQLNIRTTLPNAHVEVYDINGKLICNQEITDVITSIDTENWSSGIYVWKVVSDSKDAEIGKWVK